MTQCKASTACECCPPAHPPIRLTFFRPETVSSKLSPAQILLAINRWSRLPLLAPAAGLARAPCGAGSGGKPALAPLRSVALDQSNTPPAAGRACLQLGSSAHQCVRRREAHGGASAHLQGHLLAIGGNLGACHGGADPLLPGPEGLAAQAVRIAEPWQCAP